MGKKSSEELGAGEILLTDVDREGTGCGFDTKLVKTLSSALSIPLIACGGPKNLEHILEVISQGEADAVALSSMLHYACLRRKEISPTANGEGNIAFMSSGQEHTKFKGVVSISDIKKHLLDNKIPCRYEN